MDKITVYVPMRMDSIPQNVGGYYNEQDKTEYLLEKKENVYVLDEKGMRELLNKVWDEACGATDNNTEPTYEDSQCTTDWNKVNTEQEKFIDNLLK